VTFALDIRLPIRLYAHPPEIGGILAAERRKSAVNARDLAATVDAVCAQGGARYEHSVEHCTWADIPKVLTDQARLRDLCIFPVITTDRRATYLLSRRSSSCPGDRCYCCPKARRGNCLLEVAAVAWDHSRSATRAAADALPLLQAAKRVHKPGSGVELCKHLARHGVEVTFDQIQAKGRSVGDVLEAHVTERNIDLLVMGGYAHSKLREFILGGATRSVVARPFTWTLLSH
jgi:nucleotide-binding universal stress UspA family protein